MMKWIVIMMMVGSAFAGNPIEGIGKYKLGSTITSKAKPSGSHPYYYRMKKGEPRLSFIGNEKKKITMIIARFSYEQDYQYKTTVDAYAKHIDKAVKKYGEGKGDTTATFRGRESYVITKEGKSITISKNGPYIMVVYQYVEEKKEKEEEPLEI